MNLIDLRCVDGETWRGWLHWARIAPTKQSLFNTFCGDCTKLYRREMAREGKCVRGPIVSEAVKKRREQVEAALPVKWGDYKRLGEALGVTRQTIAEDVKAIQLARSVYG